MRRFAVSTRQCKFSRSVSQASMLSQQAFWPTDPPYTPPRTRRPVIQSPRPWPLPSRPQVNT